MRTILITLLLVAGWAIGQTFYEPVAPVSLGTADGINYYTVISGEGGGGGDAGWDDQNPYVILNLPGLTNESMIARDISGLNNTGVLTGTSWVTLGTNTDPLAKNYGRVKHGFLLDGTDDVLTVPFDGFVYIPGDVSNSGLVQRIYCAWYKISSHDKSYMCLVYQASAGGFNIYSSKAGDFNNASAYSYGFNYSTAPNGIGLEWVHIGLVWWWDYPDSKGRVDFYTNGVLQASSPKGLMPGNARMYTWLPIAIGVTPAVSGRRYTGTVCDMVYATNVVGSSSDWSNNLSASGLYISNRWYNTGGRYTNQPWMSNENGY